MRSETSRAIERIGTLTSSEWEAIRVRALDRKVGAYAWDAAWIAAKTGQLAGITAQQHTLECGASNLAAAAVAGAVAAIEARNQVSAQQYRTLLDPVGERLGSAGPEPARWQRLWRSSRLCPVAAALYG
jgi:hypothetical protein